MDIVLEIFDTFLLDRLYAIILPGTSPMVAKTVVQDVTTTFSSMREMPTPYHSASQFLQMEPSVYAYMSAWPRDSIWRQTLSLYLITWLFGLVVYFLIASLSYLLIFDHATFTHPKYLKNQIRLEIRQALSALPVMAVFTTPFFVGEVRGYAKLYDAFSDAPFSLYNVLQFPFFIGFTDCFVYCAHRSLHHPYLYRRLHKPHHKWLVPTPFASHAFHPVDGFMQSLPYHVFPFLFPLQKFVYIILFVFVNIWTVFIHDGEYVANSAIINGAACHTLHHLQFNYNYGQFTTLWDRLGGSYRMPDEESYKEDIKKSVAESVQRKEAQEARRQIEGEIQNRTYDMDPNSMRKKLI